MQLQFLGVRYRRIHLALAPPLGVDESSGTLQLRFSTMSQQCLLWFPATLLSPAPVIPPWSIQSSSVICIITTFRMAPGSAAMR